MEWLIALGVGFLLYSKYKAANPTVAAKKNKKKSNVSNFPSNADMSGKFQGVCSTTSQCTPIAVTKKDSLRFDNLDNILPFVE